MCAAPHLGAGARARLLARMLARYLAETIVVERDVVNPVAHWIAHGATRFAFPDRVRDAALRLHADEEDHARQAHALLQDLGIAVPCEAPPFVDALHALLETLSTELRPLVRFFFVVVTETTVSDRLSLIGDDVRIEPRVRAFVAAHARDERWHAGFFRARCVEVWSQLEPHERMAIGPLLPRLVELYVGPAASPAAADLVREGLEPQAATRALRRWLSAPNTRTRTAHAASGTLEAFREAGVLGHPATGDAFARSALGARP